MYQLHICKNTKHLLIRDNQMNKLQQNFKHKTNILAYLLIRCEPCSHTKVSVRGIFSDRSKSVWIDYLLKIEFLFNIEKMHRGLAFVKLNL